MWMGFRHSNWKAIVGAVLLSSVASLPLVSQAQSPGDVIRIGSPTQWSQFESYWNQLLNLGAPPAPASADQSFASDPSAVTSTDPQVLERTLAKRLRVSNLRLAPIVKLNGSSLLMGSITNGNNKAVTVSGINLEVLDSNGKLVQTNSVAPEPATIPPGATVTFQRELQTVPADGGYRVRLSKTPFSLQGGV
ncbi:MAG: DUF3426 domain-containing protein [Acaryochloridaceae cyanobacterium RU_4_10]|nr:DUF3426 domain-containing protein [Acaryochloridaceae cyanobacterium RU_4_10]